ncbi:uncharacterized protein BYT42DRAFT_489150 [Radiomyces spectabilis]|uniref:uncharacterized protein n=1 Tax=Radiomyces spectabilis TaxID=64574 RepID=UPI0022205423|nr:uncharacterized protein BYT42DRAFT_489150 [Radiomyces spectabilis]KAI8390830.1 hypothetical protein BYT42DRAFT_489150 [Radiomyces spectabilis]
MIHRLSSMLDEVTSQLHEKRRELGQKSASWTMKTKSRINHQTNKLEERRAAIQNELLRHYQTINDRIHQHIKLRDKISFVVGVANACVTPVVASRIPEWIPVYYTAQCAYLLTLRFFLYKLRHWHYFIFDLCYFVNVMVLAFLWIWPSSPSLFVAAFSLTNGPVAWAIVTWRNSLVFHSLDKVTSVFIHIFPPLVMYTIRWMPELHRDRIATTLYRNQHFLDLNELKVTFGSIIYWSTAAYLIWQALYFVFIIVRRKEKVESGARITSYSWLLKETQKRKSLIQRAAFAFGPKYKIYMFMLLQLAYNLVTVIPTYFLYKSFWLHTVFLISMFAASVWNGANYYIEIFSRRYIAELEKVVNKSQNMDPAEKTTDRPLSSETAKKVA